MDDRVIRISIGDQVYSNSASRLSKEGDAAWVTSELLNVVPRPLKRTTMVVKSKVRRNARDAREAKDVETVVDAHDYHIVFIGKYGTIGDRLG